MVSVDSLTSVPCFHKLVLKCGLHGEDAVVAYDMNSCATERTDHAEEWYSSVAPCEVV